MSKCPFLRIRICHYYDKKSFTCNRDPNSYCGKYREFSLYYRIIKRLIKLDNKINELTSKRYFDKKYNKSPKKRKAVESKIRILEKKFIALQKIYFKNQKTMLDVLR